MTREEAIDIIKCLAWHRRPPEEEVEMAIQTLKQEPCYVELTVDRVKRMAKEPCEDAVSRQGLLDDFGLSEKTRKYGGDHSGYDTMMLYEIQNVIESAESVNPQKSGKWKRVSMEKYVQHAMAYYVCSDCGGENIGKSNYCPNCGAKMQEDEKNE